MKLRVLCLLVLAIVSLWLAVASSASHAEDSFELISQSTSGEKGNDISYDPRMCSDGRYVVFRSASTNIDGDTGGLWQLFLRDRVTKETTMITKSPSGQPGNASAVDNISISSDCRYVAFVSSASNLVDPPANDNHIYVYDTLSRSLTWVTKKFIGLDSRNYQQINVNGHFVAFSSFTQDWWNPLQKMIINIYDLSNDSMSEIYSSYYGYTYYGISVSEGGCVSYALYDKYTGKNSAVLFKDGNQSVIYTTNNSIQWVMVSDDCHKLIYSDVRIGGSIPEDFDQIIYDIDNQTLTSFTDVFSSLRFKPVVTNISSDGSFVSIVYEDIFKHKYVFLSST